ncbi:glycoside hydrolase [Apiospora arundinis]|uniref:chitinase n=1 Tax=Apiospora arundinis TaxID=335852 RepID=A0ABR2IA38_9PEZI
MRLIATLALFVGLLSLQVLAACNANNPCPSGSGCCSQWGNCGWGDEFCGKGCLNNCDAVPAETECSVSKPCASGCCSQFGNCGWGKDFCGKGCLSSCDAVPECDASRPCKTGCCGANGVCGTGPDYCSKDKCINSCDFKAECDPGGWGSEFVKSSKCPLNVCCSDFGFCGTTEKFCGDKKVERPSCSVGDTKIDRVVGYYESWSTSRSCHTMRPLLIPQGVYSHINFAFVSIDPKTFRVVPTSASDYDLLAELKTLRTRDIGLQLWLAIGGWTFNDDTSATVTTFSDLARADETYQKVFFSSLTLFMMEWGFTGIDIDWEYPSADDRSGRPEDYETFPKFLKSLKAYLSDYNYGLSITIPTSYWYLQHFDITAIEPYVDWFNIMSYDLHGTWDIGGKWSGAILNAHTNLTEIETAMDLVWRNGIDPSKITLGMAFYGRTSTLIGNCNTPGCTYASAGDKGPCSQETGILLNSEISDIIRREKLRPTLHKDAAVKTITWGQNQWVSFDDKETFKLKGDFAKSQCLGGIMVWAISHDDEAVTNAYGLAEALGNELKVNKNTGVSWAGSLTNRATGSNANPEDKFCRWTNCGEECPNGFSQIARDDKRSEVMLDASACSAAGNKGIRLFCCPSSNKPTCRWRGHHNTGKCKGGCASGEVEVNSISAQCRSGHQAACCTNTESTAPWGECKWTGCTNDAGKCPSDFPNFVVSAPSGTGGLERCSNTRNYCCKGSSVPKAFEKCGWDAKPAQSSNGKSDYCMASCSAGQIPIATDTIDDVTGAHWGHGTNMAHCSTGYKAFCCAGPADTSKQEPRTVPVIYNDEKAMIFDGYLQRWLKDPVCPADWMSHHESKTANHKLAARDLLSISNDAVSALVGLAGLLVREFSNRFYRRDLSEMFDLRMQEAGLFDGDRPAANFSTVYSTLWGNGQSMVQSWDPDSITNDFLCNFQDSSFGMRNLEGANELFCVYPQDSRGQINHRSIDNNSSISSISSISSSQELASRTFNEITMVNRAGGQAAQDQPGVAFTLEGIMNGDLPFHYARWLPWSEGRQDVILELAYWIGDELGVDPDFSNQTGIWARYRDRSHYVRYDRWVVLHLHAALDSWTLMWDNGVWRFGVTTFDMFHSQQSRRDDRGEYRAQWSLSSTWANGAENTGDLTNYNSRSFALNCPIGSGASRWYIGQDRTALLADRRRTNRPMDFVDTLNRFGQHLQNSGVVSLANLQWVWSNLPRNGPPSSSGYWDGRNPRSRQGAYQGNWVPDGTGGSVGAPDLSTWLPLIK